MKRNKKVIESMTVTSAMLVMTAITALGSSTEEAAAIQTESLAADANGTAGIICELGSMEMDSVETGKIRQDIFEESVSLPEKPAAAPSENPGILSGKTEVVQETAAQEAEAVTDETSDAAGFLTQTAGFGNVAAETALQNIQTEIFQEIPREEMELTAGAQDVLADALDLAGTAEAAAVPEEVKAAPEAAVSQETVIAPEPIAPEPAAQAADEWQNRVMADVEKEMNIRTAPDETSGLAGKFYRGDVAEVLSIEDGWTQIASGNVTGYVKNDYLVYGQEASELADEVCSLYATVQTDGLRLRSEPSEEAEVITTANNGEKLKVDKEAAEIDGWIAVQTSKTTAYVSAEYVGVALNLGTALTSEEAAAKEVKEAEAAKTVQKPAVAAGVDEVTLLGALIQCEAGGGSYEGMLAVGSVVMNRVRSGAYPSSISGVIYQSGQFPPALNGKVASVAAGGVSGACMQAASEAINGADNTNGAVSFRSASSGCVGTLIGANVFF